MMLLGAFGYHRWLRARERSDAPAWARDEPSSAEAAKALEPGELELDDGLVDALQGIDLSPPHHSGGWDGGFDHGGDGGGGGFHHHP